MLVGWQSDAMFRTCFGCSICIYGREDVVFHVFPFQTNGDSRLGSMGSFNTRAVPSSPVTGADLYLLAQPRYEPAPTNWFAWTCRRQGGFRMSQPKPTWTFNVDNFWCFMVHVSWQTSRISLNLQTWLIKLRSQGSKFHVGNLQTHLLVWQICLHLQIFNYIWYMFFFFFRLYMTQNVFDIIYCISFCITYVKTCEDIFVWFFVMSSCTSSTPTSQILFCDYRQMQMEHLGWLVVPRASRVKTARWRSLISEARSPGVNQGVLDFGYRLMKKRCCIVKFWQSYTDSLC